jgi:hypothetical protein
MLRFHEYSHKEDLIGDGWQLYDDEKPSSYFFFIEKNKENYELFYGNGFFIARSNDINSVKQLTLELYEKYPLMGHNVPFVVEEFRSIKSMAGEKGFDTKLDLSEFLN